MILSRPSDDISDFLNFLALTMGDEVVCARQSAHPEDLAKLMALVRLPLPPLYHSYLQEFGGSSGSFRLADDTGTDVKALICFYEEPEPIDRGIPERGVVIAAYGLSGERALVYPKGVDLSAGAGAPLPAPAVVVSWWGDVSHTSAHSFRNHLYRQAFVQGCMAEGSHCSLYRNDPDLFPIACSQVETQGFVAHWFSDNSQCCLEREDGSFFYIERTRERTSLYGCLVDARTRDQIKSVLISALELRDSTPNR